MMANVITGTRIVLALILIFCPTFSESFYIVYILAGISDVLDGFVARYFGKETKFGAKLDTVADIVFTVIVILKVVQTVQVPSWLFVWIICIAAIKCTNLTLGLIVYKSIISEHTLMNKICGVILFIIPFCIGRFPWQFVTMLIILTCVIATIAAIQEEYYIRTGKDII